MFIQSSCPIEVVCYLLQYTHLSGKSSVKEQNGRHSWFAGVLTCRGGEQLCLCWLETPAINFLFLNFIRFCSLLGQLWI